jgi:glucose-1-phosphate thymidylyltransferase
MIGEGHEITALQTEGFWQDAVYPWDILKLNDTCLSNISPGMGGTIEDGAKIKGTVSIGDGSIIRSNCYIVGPVIIGEDCEIGPDVCIFPSSSIGNNVVLSPFSVVRNSAIENSVSIGPGSTIQDSIIAYGTTIGSHFAARSGKATIMIENEYHQIEMGAIIGNYTEFEDYVVVEPGIIIGNNCRIKSMKVLNENIPDRGLVR